MRNQEREFRERKGGAEWCGLALLTPSELKRDEDEDESRRGHKCPLTPLSKYFILFDLFF